MNEIRVFYASSRIVKPRFNDPYTNVEKLDMIAVSELWIHSEKYQFLSTMTLPAYNTWTKATLHKKRGDVLLYY